MRIYSPALNFKHLAEGYMRLSIFTICAILFFQYNFGFAQTMRVGLLNFPPFGIEGEEEHDPPQGIIVDRLSKTFNKIGLKNKIRIYPALRLFKGFESGSVDFLLASESQIDRFKKIAVFSVKPLMTIKLRAYAFNENIPLPKLKEDLNGMRIVTIRGYSYLGYLKHINDPKNKIINNIVDTYKSGFFLLISGRADILLGYAFPAEFAINNLPEFQFNYKNLFEQNIFFSLSKNYPNYKIVLDKIVESYRALGYAE